jgi:uncharacterized protein (TIGR03000 family)
MTRRALAGLFGLMALLLLAPALVGQDQGPAQEAFLDVRLPANAKLEIQGRLTTRTGENRRFVSPPLALGKKYTYTLVATWAGPDGKEVRRVKEVQVFPGRTVEVDLTKPTADEAPKKDDKKPADAPKKDDKKEEKKPADTTKKEDKKPADTPKKDDKKPAEAPRIEDRGRAPAPTPPAPAPATPRPATPAPAAPAPAAPVAPAVQDRKPDVEYVPTPQEVVDEMLKLAKVTKDDIVYDLGCGDGRIPVTAAKKYGCKAYGFDIDPERIKESLDNIKKEKVESLVTVEKKDIFTLDLSKATVVALYLLPELNAKLVPQLEKLKPGSRIVSHDFKMGDIKPDETKTIKGPDREHTIYLWTVPLKKTK